MADRSTTRSGGASSAQPAIRASDTVRATSAPNDQPATTNVSSGARSASTSTAASMSRCSLCPWSWVPSEPSTPRKLKRNAARPASGSNRNSSLVTNERMVPPWAGCGCASTTAARG